MSCGCIQREWSQPVGMLWLRNREVHFWLSIASEQWEITSFIPDLLHWENYTRKSSDSAFLQQIWMLTRAEACCMQKWSKTPRWGSDRRKTDKANGHERQEMYEGEYNEGFVPCITFYCSRKFRRIWPGPSAFKHWRFAPLLGTYQIRSRQLI